MNSRPAKRTVLVLSDEDTRRWHSVFSRELRETHRALILDQCEKQARAAESTEYVVYDAYETQVAKGTIAPAA